MSSAVRTRVLRAAVWISAASVVWGICVGTAAITIAAASQSTALLALGIESIVDASASAVLVWRFHREGGDQVHGIELEQVGRRVVGAILVVASLYVGGQAVRELLTRSGPTHERIGIAIAGSALVVLPVLAVLKWRLAHQLGSVALRGDAVLSAGGACLAAATLFGLGLSGAFGWWWADPAAALTIACALAVEGVRVSAA
jgi:divalent metal cation (Fe/Co/Zn/Cd) transporter